MIELFRQRRGFEPGGLDGRQRGKRVLQAMRRSRRQAEFDWLAVHLHGDIPALTPSGVFQRPHLGSLAEAKHLAVPFRRLDIVRQHQHTVLWQALS